MEGLPVCGVHRRQLRRRHHRPTPPSTRSALSTTRPAGTLSCGRRYPRLYKGHAAPIAPTAGAAIPTTIESLTAMDLVEKKQWGRVGRRRAAHNVGERHERVGPERMPGSNHYRMQWSSCMFSFLFLQVYVSTTLILLVKRCFWRENAVSSLPLTWQYYSVAPPGVAWQDQIFEYDVRWRWNLYKNCSSRWDLQLCCFEFFIWGR
jgi:hypothetical protein